jgi:thymidylate kinase
VLITVSGIDCAGKSTQVERLRDHFRGNGRRVEVLWYRPGYSPLLDRARAAVRALRPGSLPTADRPEARARAFARRGVAEVWIVTALLDMLVTYAVKLRRLLAGGGVVICDRYLDDAVLDFELRFPEHAHLAARGVRALRLVSPIPDASLLLTLDRDEMLARAASKAEPFEDAPEIREARYRAYLELAASGKMINVDAGHSIEAVHAAIREALATSCLAGARR